MRKQEHLLPRLSRAADATNPSVTSDMNISSAVVQNGYPAFCGRCVWCSISCKLFCDAQESCPELTTTIPEPISSSVIYVLLRRVGAQPVRCARNDFGLEHRYRPWCCKEAGDTRFYAWWWYKSCSSAVRDDRLTDPKASVDCLTFPFASHRSAADEESSPGPVDLGFIV